MGKRILDLLIVILAAVLIFSGYNLWKGLSEYKKGEAEYAQTAESFMSTQEQPAAEEGTEQDPCPITVDFDGLLAQNQDVVGWIYSEDTPINYPVVRGATNDTYLHTTVNGQANSSGSIFMDYRCEPDLSGFNTIIYGHHMKNGSMFASLRKYSSQEYYDEHQVMWYLTPSGNYRLIVYAGYVGEADAEVYEIFPDQDKLRSYLEFARAKSNFRPSEENTMAPEDISRAIVLSTCSYEYDDARYVVVCIPVPVN